MSKYLFISDLHLSPTRQDITALFVDFLQTRAVGAKGLFILGDLFEVWLGDDVSLADHRQAVSALRALSDSGTPIFYLHGNRDFSVGGLFALNTGIQIFDDPSAIELDGQKVLISHGDALCTDDIQYQRLRKIIRHPWVLSTMLALPKVSREWIGSNIRKASTKSQQSKPMSIMDVNDDAVAELMRDRGIYTLVHGHTHRPHQHYFSVDDTPAERHVLGDWYTQGSVLTLENGQWQLESMPFLGSTD